MPSAYAESKKDSKTTRDDIGGLMAELSKRQRRRNAPAS